VELVRRYNVKYITEAELNKIAKIKGDKYKWKNQTITKTWNSKKSRWDISPALFGDLALKCLGCDSYYLVEECVNCGLDEPIYTPGTPSIGSSPFFCSEDQNGNLGICCRRCFQGIATPWECVRCGTKNPIYKTLYELSSGCFIATATYGTAQEFEIDVFRHYRESVLRQSALGKLLIWYYDKYSPNLARIVERYPVMRIVSRHLFLSPILFIIKLGMVNDGK